MKSYISVQRKLQNHCFFSGTTVAEIPALRTAYYCKNDYYMKIVSCLFMYYYYYNNVSKLVRLAGSLARSQKYLRFVAF